jgi:hypothetical protein
MISLTETDANKLLEILGAPTALCSEPYSCCSVLTVMIKVTEAMTFGRVWLTLRTGFAVRC